MRKPLLGALTLAAMSLAACGGGGGTTASVTPSGAGAGAGAVANAKASITLQIPKLAASNIGSTGSTSSANGRKSPQYISPGSDKLSFILDGTPVVTDQEVVNYNNAGPHNNGTFDLPNGLGTVQIAYDGTSSQAYFAVTAAFTVTPGNHTIGVVDLDGSDVLVLSEGQRTYSFKPGTNDFTGQPLSLKGVVASGYIECATAAQNLVAGGTCDNYANWNAGGNYYTFTAVAADFNGFPIVEQGLGFDNGTFTVAESASDVPSGIVTISNAGPWGDPGSDITGPSGGWAKGSSFAYGHNFNATCNKVGTANLQLSLNASTPNTPDHSPDAGKYPPLATAGGLLPLGVNPSNAPRITNVAVTCTSTGTIIIQ